MADLLFLPTTSQGYMYCLVVVDLFTSAFDIQEIKDKQSSTVLNAIKQIYKRKYVKKPYGSIRTDGATDFKGVFQKWLYKESILHKVSIPNRHSQMSTVDSLCKQLGRLFMGYLNTIEEQTGKRAREWTTAVPLIRKYLNEYRKKDLKNVEYPNSKHFFDPEFASKYNIGDVVYYKLDTPKDSLGHNQSTPVFRTGDSRYSKIPKKITKVILMNTKPFYRYILEGIDNVSYTERQLFRAGVNETESKFEVHKIIGDKYTNGIQYYKIWWKGELKKNATFEPEDQLIQDGLQSMIDEYNDD